MEINSERRYFWQRQPAWANRLVVGSLVPAAAIVALVVGLTVSAWSLADADGGSSHYSLTMHVIAMLGLSALAVAVASALVVQRKPVLGAVVLVATAFGPMTIVAAPVRASLVSSNWQDTQPWWHVVVGSVLTVILSGWTWWVARCLPKPVPSTDAHSSSLWALLPDLVFLVSAGASVFVYLSLPAQSNQPAMRAMVGWAILAAGIVTAVGFAKRWWTSVLAGGLAAVALGLIFLAYSRDGGWPGVAGWEYQGMESPIITSVGASISLLSAWLIGLLVWGARHAAIRLVGSTSAPALATQD